MVSAKQSVEEAKIKTVAQSIKKIGSEIIRYESAINQHLRIEFSLARQLGQALGRIIGLEKQRLASARLRRERTVAALKRRIAELQKKHARLMAESKRAKGRKKHRAKRIKEAKKARAKIRGEIKRLEHKIKKEHVRIKRRRAKKVLKKKPRARPKRRHVPKPKKIKKPKKPRKKPRPKLRARKKPRARKPKAPKAKPKKIAVLKPKAALKKPRKLPKPEIKKVAVEKPKPAAEKPAKPAAEAAPAKARLGQYRDENFHVNYPAWKPAARLPPKAAVAAVKEPFKFELLKEEKSSVLLFEEYLDKYIAGLKSRLNAKIVIKEAVGSSYYLAYMFKQNGKDVLCKAMVSLSNNIIYIVSFTGPAERFPEIGTEVINTFSSIGFS